MGTVMCDSRLQAILLLCAALSVSAELLVEDPDGNDGKVDVQRGQIEPVMVEVQRPSREEPRVEGRMVKTMTSPSQVWAAVWDGLRLGKRSLKGLMPVRTDPYWLSWWKTEPKWTDNFQEAKATMTGNREIEARKKDMEKVFKALGAMLSEEESE